MKKAFSLIELSIVILIIGILIAGVTQGSRLVKKFRVRTAQSLTQSSPVAGIKDLLVWLETSMDASFISTEAQDSTPISSWNDINPQGSLKLNATQSTAGTKPLYMEDVFNSAIPAIRFDGIDDNMPIDLSSLVGSNYTIFAVEQRRSATVPNFFLSGSGTTTDSNLILGWNTNTSVELGHYSDDIGYTNAALAYTIPIAYIHTFRFSQDVGVGKAYWMNGGTTAEATGTAQITPLASFAAPALGRHASAYFYNGDLAEIIVFTRALKTEERQAIETYLSKKYNIKLS